MRKPLKPVKITFQDVDLFLEAEIDDDGCVIWRADPSEYDDEHSYHINSALTRDYNEEVCALIVGEFERIEQEAELEHQLYNEIADIVSTFIESININYWIKINTSDAILLYTQIDDLIKKEVKKEVKKAEDKCSE